MSQSTSEIFLYGADGNDAKLENANNKLSFSGVDRYDFDNDVYAKNVKLANENDIQNLQSEIDSILPLSNYAYINGNDETSQLGGIPFGTGSINTLIQSPDFVYDNVNKVVKVDNINLATQTQIDTLQNEIDNIPGGNPNVWINGAGQTTTNQQILFTDNSQNGAITDPSFTYQNFDNQPFLSVGAAAMISVNNNMKLESTDYILTTKDLFLQGQENDIQRYLTMGVQNQANNVKTSVDINTLDYIIDNQIGNKTQLKGASEYDFDNDVKIGDDTTTKKLYVNGVEITSGSGNPNALITTTPLTIPEEGAVVLSDGVSSTTTTASNGLRITGDVIRAYSELECSLSATFNNSINIQNNSYPVSMYMDEDKNFQINNAESSSITNFTGSTEYDFDNTVKIGDNTTSKKIYLNDVDIGAQVSTNTSNITTLQGQVSTNTSDISTINGKLKQNLSNYYVSTSGNDSTGDGTIYNPWQTIDKAIEVLSAISGDIQAAVNLSAGTYNINLITITKSGISIIGASSSLPNLTVINGSLTWNMNAGTGLYSVGGVQNCQLNGTLGHFQTNTYTNSISVLNCLIFAQSGKRAISTIGLGGTTTLGDMTVQACSIYGSDVIAVVINGTAISMINTLITNSPLLATGSASFVSVTGNGRINLFGCSLIQGSSASNVSPLVLVNNSSNSASPAQINSCILAYTSSASDAGTGNKACIKFSGTASMGTYTIVYNYLLCVGATTSAPNAVCIQRTGTSTLALILGGNFGVQGYHNVAAASGSYSKTILQAAV